MRTLEHGLRRLEGRLGMDRQGRTVWVWAFPLVIGVFSGVVAVFVALPAEASWMVRIILGVFGFVSMTAIAGIYLLSFSGDKNQQADDSDRS
jgi:hypothetical protein